MQDMKTRQLDPGNRYCVDQTQTRRDEDERVPDKGDEKICSFALRRSFAVSSKSPGIQGSRQIYENL